MKSNLPPTAPKQNKTDKLQYDMIYLIVGSFILYVIYQIFEFIFRPLRMLSQDEVEERFERIIHEKRMARRVRTIDDPNDPMNQFKVRFIDKDLKYKRDKENNQIYFAWFQEWQSGNIIDSDLRWAPEALDTDNTLRSNFIQYMKIQYQLHKKASIVKRMLFLNTIYKYYPELSPNMRGLANDLSNYEEENTEIEIENELRKEIQKYGLPEEIVDYLVKKDINASTLRKEAKQLKGYIEAGHTAEASICVLENKFSDDAFAPIELICKYGLPTKVGVAYVLGYLNDDEVVEIKNLMQHVQENYGTYAWDIIPGKDKTAYDDILDGELERLTNKKIVKKLNEKVCV